MLISILIAISNSIFIIPKYVIFVIYISIFSFMKELVNAMIFMILMLCLVCLLGCRLLKGEILLLLINFIITIVEVVELLVFIY